MKFTPKRLESTRDLSRGRTDYQGLIVALLTFLAALGITYAALGYFIDYAAVWMDDDTEVTLLGALERAYPAVSHGDDSEEGVNLQRAKTVFKQLTTYPNLRKLPYELRMIDFDAPNAFAIPGGIIALSPKLFDWVKTDAGLAFVLAHELAHHQRRHVTKRLGRGLVLMLFEVLALSVSDTNLGQLSGVAIARYSQSQEHEADELAIRIMFATYGHADGALEFLSKALDESSLQGGSLWDSHPSTQERIDRVRRLVSSYR